jgi:hypothetical protein
MMFGARPLGTFPFAAADGNALTAGFGSFRLAGEAAIFQTQEAAAVGNVTFTGEPVAFQAELPPAFGAFTRAGEAAAFETFLVSGPGSFGLAGQATTLQPQLVAASGAFAERGVAATFETNLAATEDTIFGGALGSSPIGTLALGQAIGDVAAFPLTFTCTLTGFASLDFETEVAGCGRFTFTGGPYTFLSYDLLGGGGTIVAGTFSRERWRALQDEIAAEQAAARAEIAARKRRRREQAQAAARAKQERIRAAHAAVEAANATAAGERALADALAVGARVTRAHDLMRHTAALHALAVAAQVEARTKAQDEDEAIALLLAA